MLKGGANYLIHEPRVDGNDQDEQGKQQQRLVDAAFLALLMFGLSLLRSLTGPAVPR